MSKEQRQTSNSDMSGEPDISLCMERDDLADLPEVVVPDGFHLSSYRSGYEAAWLEIHIDADRRNRFDEETFRRQFGNDRRLLTARQIYLVTDSGEIIGTSTAWFSGDLGRVHWVAIRGTYQGLGLAKPLLAETCRRLAEFAHPRAYLTTSSSRIAALGLYLSFAFRPAPRSDSEESAWSTILERVTRDRATSREQD
jgi:GNAT superfamily N-acetyltransferase